MKNEIEQIIVNHINRKISLGEATTQILRLFAVSGRSEQLSDSLQNQIKRGELDPYSPHAKWVKP